MKGNYSILPSNELSKLIPILIELIKDMRNADMDLLLAAAQDYKDGKDIDPKTVEKALSLLAYITTVLSPFYTEYSIAKYNKNSQIYFKTLSI